MSNVHKSKVGDIVVIDKNPKVQFKVLELKEELMAPVYVTRSRRDGVISSADSGVLESFCRKATPAEIALYSDFK